MSVSNVVKKFSGILSILIVIVLVGFTVMNSFFQTESGYIYHYENPFTGTKVYKKPGFRLRLPFLSTVTRYPQVWTANFSRRDSQRRHEEAVTLGFSDATTATIHATFRYKLPENEKQMETLHQDFRSFEGLIDSLLITTARDVMVKTATLYTGEEFFTGGFNKFKIALGDQLKHGLYKTEYKEVEVEPITWVPACFQEPSSLQAKTKKIWKTVPVIDKDGHYERLEKKKDNNNEKDKEEKTEEEEKQPPLWKYKIKVLQITLAKPKPGQELEARLVNKKHLVADCIKDMKEKQEALKQKALDIIAKQRELDIAKKQHELAIEKKKHDIEVAKEQHKLALLAKENELDLALKQEQLLEMAKQRKAEALEKAKQSKVEEVKKQADKEVIEAEKAKKIAEIDKAKELAVAEANKKIQQFNYEAAKFEAKAILEKGKAEAEVLKAKYEARTPELYKAEIQRDIAQIIYPNLKGINVTMPHNIVNLGDKDNPLQTNLDVLSSFATIGVMEGLEKKALANMDTAATPSETVEKKAPANMDTAATPSETEEKKTLESDTDTAATPSETQ
jgi:hypothetical protein